MFTLFKNTIARLLLVLLRVKVTIDAQTVRHLDSGKTILCSNHVSLLDGIVVSLASPRPLIFAVDTDFSRTSPASARFLSFFAWLKNHEIVPIDGSHPFGIRTLSVHLKMGRNVMVFPEGRISPTGEPLPVMPGITWLASRTGASVRWAHIAGAENSRFFAKAGRHIWPRIELIF